ncbi:hypothetical protein L249_7807 [Ophiocordyceps polyrhachis-furcata BCC 54312]|uniref:Uncharacterized protein n=1 Tax=Ophiocordyceps polyrhachis-furcata BCC 54312 TaxID=1330021 RepID=A0A367L0L0_9HYPO|nr:hypothetical protein L249_7807 [Ophiocordyceps polyrhachis-furcata BCC 54312]
MPSTAETTPLLPSSPERQKPWPPKPAAALPPKPSPTMDLHDTLHHVIIGFSDGLTVPFALTAGLSSLGSSRLVVLGGLAELFSGMISMGLGAYLAAVTERNPPPPAAATAQDDDLYSLLREGYDLSPAVVRPLVEELSRDASLSQRFREHLVRDKSSSRHHSSSSDSRPCLAGLTMGTSYFVGGLIPMLPYFFAARVRDALLVSVGVTVVTLLAFGYVKDYLAVRSHRAGCWGALQTLVVGVLAAGISYGIVRALDASRGEP